MSLKHLNIGTRMSARRAAAAGCKNRWPVLMTFELFGQRTVWVTRCLQQGNPFCIVLASFVAASAKG
jgi:hypothetical protein